MKHFFGLLFLFFAFNSCDDGDFTIENIDFTSVTLVEKCSEKDVFYKLKETELLFLELNLNQLPTDVTTEPLQIQIGSANQLKYRQYAGVISDLNLCPQVPNASPNIVEEWVATSGIIEIITTAVYAPVNAQGVQLIRNYNHNISFKNLVFIKPDGSTQSYTSYPFGNYATSNINLPFSFDNQVDKTTCNNTIYNISGSGVLLFNAENFSDLFANEVTTTPRTATINTMNTLRYNVYDAAVTLSQFCPIVPLPILSQQWIAQSGTIEVTTVSFGANFEHTIRFKNAVFKRGNSTFTLGTDYLFGSFVN
jgi:hypothetical protein